MIALLVLLLLLAATLAVIAYCDEKERLRREATDVIRRLNRRAEETSAAMHDIAGGEH